MFSCGGLCLAYGKPIVRGQWHHSGLVIPISSVSGATHEAELNVIFSVCIFPGSGPQWLFGGALCIPLH
jgi:hypothetical protein